jgi:CRISPR/Cas system endoribonuclease Cas6 (RAMP superfamily)
LKTKLQNIRDQVAILQADLQAVHNEMVDRLGSYSGTGHTGIAQYRLVEVKRELDAAIALLP